LNYQGGAFELRSAPEFTTRRNPERRNSKLKDGEKPCPGDIKSEPPNPDVPIARLTLDLLQYPYICLTVKSFRVKLSMGFSLWIRMT
jgi:hypothetical protein